MLFSSILFDACFFYMTTKICGRTFLYYVMGLSSVVDLFVGISEVFGPLQKFPILSCDAKNMADMGIFVL